MRCESYHLSVANLSIHARMTVMLWHSSKLFTCSAGGLAVLAVLMQSQRQRGAGGSDGPAAASISPLRTALDSMPQTARDPSTPALFDLAALLPAARSASSSSRAYVYYDGALTHVCCSSAGCSFCART